MKDKLAFIIIFSIGLFFRLHNLSPFKIYPDAYENLLVAMNITTYHSVVGYLGPNGLLFPDFFMWTRPGYALLINFVTFFTNDMTQAAQLIALVAGIAAIPLAFLFIKNVWGKTHFALAGALFVAFSFNHTVWSGFIMTETVGVFFMLLFLFHLFARLKEKQSYTKDFLTGLFFALTVITRYEYIIIIFPLCFLLFHQSQRPWEKLLSILAGTIVTIAVIATQLFPLQSTLLVILQQLQSMLITTGVVLIIFLLFFLTIFLIPKDYKNKLLPTVYKFLLGNFFVLASIITVQIIIGSNFSLFWNDLSFIRNFVQHDFLISIFFLIGLTLFYRQQKLQLYGLFVMTSALLLSIIYYRVNPDMDRYITHLIPLLLIPASYGLVTSLRIMSKANDEAISTKKRLPRRLGLLAMTKALILLTSVGLLVLFQGFQTYHGLKPSQDDSWYKTAYEEKAAKMVKKYLPSKDPLLVVSLPEPYFYNTHASIQSITDKPPFIYIDDSLNQQNIMLVVDMGMYTIFPKFTNFVNNNLQQYKQTEFWVHEKYNYENKTYKEVHPVAIYQLTLAELEMKIKILHQK